MNNNFERADMNSFSQEPNIIDCLCSLPIDAGIQFLIKKGAAVIKSVDQSADAIFKKLADEEYAKLCVSVLTFDRCVEWMKTQKKIYAQGSYFFIYIQETAKPRNENDMFSVAIALLDAQKKAIPVYAKSGLFASSEKFNKKADDIVCLVIPTGTIDGKLTTALNGTESVLIKL